MLIDIPHLSAESDHRRAAMLADAENFRLVRLARAARRARNRIVTPPTDPPRTPQEADAAPDRSEHTGSPRNDDAERRYAVSR
jgi:hypothetical protein